MKESGLPALVSIDTEQISEWRKSKFNKNIPKKFTHFDIGKSFKNPQEEIKFFEEFLLPKNIAIHKFWPFVQFISSENKFKIIDDNKFEIKPKERPITYASHQDGYIFSYYAYLLSKHYELELEKLGIGKSVLAYRSIKDGKGKGLNNIDYSQKAFKKILGYNNSVVIALDISKFFDTLNHSKLKQLLERVLGVNKLSNDWYNIFRRLTKFSYISKNDLGEYNLIKKSSYGNRKIINHATFNKVKKELKINGTKLIEENIGNKGIPQGTAISGLLANIYMLEFDIWLKEYVEELGGYYFRYSDDLLLIIPYEQESDYIKLVNKISKEIPEEIDRMLGLEINNKKTEVCIFKNKIAKNKEIKIGDIKTQNSIQYLGFSFDGKKILIRNRTLSNFYKKMISNHKRLLHLNDISVNELRPHFKGGKILYGKFNRKFLFNGRKQSYQYKKSNSTGRWKLNEDGETYYLGFLSYGYTAFEKFKPFCRKYGIQNGIRKQLARHRNKYNKLKNNKG